MSTRADPNRRRLTVGLDPGRSQQAEGSGASSGGAEDDDQTLNAMLEAYGKAAISIGAKHCPKEQKEFSEKGVEVFATESKKESVRGREEEEAAFYEMVRDFPFIDAIAFKCHKGKKPEAPNQDSFSVVVVEGEFALYCVFDGHGPLGHFASEMARVEVVAQFFRRHKVQGQSVEEALREAFLATQLKAESFSCANGDFSMSGTTCTVVYHDMVQQKLHIAHAGDSRAVIGLLDHGKVTCEDATKDHKPENPEEKKYIEQHGGRVVFDGFYNHRVFSSDAPCPGLNMSRALGDVYGHKNAGLRADPDIKEFDIRDCKKKGSANAKLLLVLCTDGVWEFVDNGEALCFFEDPEALGKKLEELTNESFQRWMKDSDNEVSDDITGVAVIL